MDIATGAVFRQGQACASLPKPQQIKTKRAEPAPKLGAEDVP